MVGITRSKVIFLDTFFFQTNRRSRLPPGKPVDHRTADSPQLDMVRGWMPQLLLFVTIQASVVGHVRTGDGFFVGNKKLSKRNHPLTCRKKKHPKKNER